MFVVSLLVPVYTQPNIDPAFQVVYQIYKRVEPAKVSVHAGLLLAVPTLLHLLLLDAEASLPTSVLGLFAVVLAYVRTFITYWGLILLYTALYRLSPFHPLARFPGPAHMKLSKLWMSYLTYRGDGHEYIRALHGQYGDVVRVGPNELSFNRADLVQPILGMKMLLKGPCTYLSSWLIRIRPSDLSVDYDTRANDAGVQLDGMRDFSVHAVRRRPWARAMNSAALKGYESIVVGRTQELMERLSSHDGEVVDISTWMSYYGCAFPLPTQSAVSADIFEPTQVRFHG